MSLIRLAWAALIAALVLLLLASLGLGLVLTRDHLSADLQRSSLLAAERLAGADHRDNEAVQPASWSLAVARARGEREDWQSVTITDHAGMLRWQRTTQATAPAPDWFNRALPLRLLPAKALIGAAANPAGVVVVLARGDGAQRLLWHLAWGITLAFALTTTLLIAGLAVLQRHARMPLDSFNEQIRALGERRFMSVRQPMATEWMELSKSLNVMVERVRLMIEEKDARLDGMKDVLDRDELTGVASRRLFMDRLSSELNGRPQDHQNADSASARELTPGAVAIVRVHDLVGMNQRVGRGRTDDLLCAVATALRTRMYRVEQHGAELARLNGADFAILLPHFSGDALTEWLTSVADLLKSLHDDQIAETAHVAWIGVSSYRVGESVSDVMSRVDAMVTASEIRREPFCFTTPSQPLYQIAVAQWRVMIETALDTGRVQLELFPVKRSGADEELNGALLHEEAMLRLSSHDGSLIPAMAFIPPAVRTGRVIDLDLRAIELALEALTSKSGDIAVNISPHSLRRPIFLRRLVEIMTRHASNARRLWLEIDEMGLSESSDDVSRLTKAVSPFGCKVGIEHFGQHFAALSRLGAIQIDYVKLDARFCTGAHGSPGQQQYVRLAVQLASASGISVIAEGVRDPLDLECLEQLGVSGATGPAVSSLFRALAEG